jgi:cell division protein FtsL
VTTIAAPPRRARSSQPATARRPARDTTRSARTSKPRATATARVEARPFAIGRLGALLVVVTVFALVTAVVFHVVLAQNQMELDHLNGQITKEQRVYEQRRLDTATLASPQNVIQQAERLGLVQPGDSATTLYVPGAPLPRTDDASTDSTIADWSKTKPSLGPQQP